MRIVLFTGKGGVGKTTTAAAAALRLADRGAKTLLLSADSAHSLGDALELQLADAPVEVVPGLSAVHIDTQGRLEAAWREVQGYLLDLLSRGGLDPVTAEELTVLPGVDEVLALLAVRQYALAGNWDAVVVDCAPTAETLRLLALPEALGWYLQRVFPLQRRIARGLRPFAAMLGRGDAIPSDGLFGALAGLAEELAGVRELLTDPLTASIRLVLTPEAVVTAEARRTFTALALYGYPVGAVVANRVFPDGGDEWRREWARRQRELLGEIRESFAGVDVLEVPYRHAEPVGVPALREVADQLYGELPGVDPAAPASGADLPRVESVDDGYVLRMPLPLTERAAVDAARIGDELVVTVGAHRRVLALPAALRRCTVVGGDYDGRHLRVRFRPDPRLWPGGAPQPHTPARPRSTGEQVRTAPRPAPRPRPGPRGSAEQAVADD
jgi:arsenite-transporting ATPase